jgi:hypothetical protein
MLAANKVEYVATDDKRQTIPWVRVTAPDGTQKIYSSNGAEMPDTTHPETEVRAFDCMDCHNRPSHKFLAPATALNLALSTRLISPSLPYIRQVGLDLLNAAYENRDQAQATIDTGLMSYYQVNYPEVAAGHAAEIAKSTQTLKTIYAENFFPEMKTDYRARENNLSHFVNDGCFRCHAGNMVSAEGDTISSACSTCHLIVAQGPSEDLSQLESSITGMEFQHPEDIGDAWKETKCTDCHTSESGY